MNEEVTITVAGPVGSAKSALLGEIEILLNALGVPVRYADPAAAQAEKNMTHADWTASFEMYQPKVVLVEHIAKGIQQEQIFERAIQLMDDAEAISVVVKMNMPSAKEQAAHGSKRTLTVATNGPGPTLLHPKPTTTGQQHVS